MINIHVIIINSKINRYKTYIKTINKILSAINNNILEKLKNHKHNPLCLDNIKSIDIKNNKLIIKYNNNYINQTILFDYNENNRSFSFCENTDEHLELIKTQLNCQINTINIYITYHKNILNKINNNNELDYNDIDCIYNFDYNIDDILKIKKHYNINNIDYYLSICPIYGFYLDKNKIYVANQYQLKFENNKFNLYYTKNHKFKTLLSRPNLKEIIEKFNLSNKKITTHNFLYVIKNMRYIITDYSITDESNNKKYNYKLDEIDKPIRTIIL
jgi:hypothetical protein